MKTLICGAVESEINLLFDKQNPQLLVRALGIGLIDSAVSLAQILSENQDIDNVVFTGTAGAYPDSGYKIGDIVNAIEHKLIGIGSIDDQSYFPKAIQTTFSFRDQFNRIFPTVRSGSVFEITKSDHLARRISEYYSVDVEHMELFSVAKICDKFAVQFNCVMGISNMVGANSHQEWVDNHYSVSMNTQKALLSNKIL